MLFETKPVSKYSCILADPPWRHTGGCGRGADAHYPVMSVPIIIESMLTVLSGRVAKRAHLWLWSTNNHLGEALNVMGSLGFDYKTNLVWVKKRREDSTGDGIAVRIGMGQYLRGAHELLLFGSRGRARLPNTADRPPSVVIAERREHSRKPDEVYDVIERVSPGPRIEMFARHRRRGWQAWGNEV